MNLSDKKTILGVLFFVLVAIAVGYFVWQDRVGNTQSAEPQISDTDEVEKTPDFTIKEIKIEAHGLDRSIKITANITEESRQKLILEIQQVSSTLKDNPDYYDGWLQLGILRKAAGDYDGAIEAWQFAGLLRPQNATSFLNLADLYAYYVRDNKKAEESFLKAISAEPKNGFPYYQAARFYDDVLSQKEKAKGILNQGISAGADTSGDLQSLLNSL